MKSHQIRMPEILQNQLLISTRLQNPQHVISQFCNIITRKDKHRHKIREVNNHLKEMCKIKAST